MTLRFEALLWCALLISAPAAANLLWRRFDPAIPNWTQPFVDGAGWFHGLMLPYFALLVGSIPARLVGLYGFSWWAWLAGGTACLSGLAAVVFANSRRHRPALRARRAIERWKDEPRWALYRATGWLLLNDIGLGAGLGFALSILEWVGNGLTSEPRLLMDQDREGLYRSGVSTILFIITNNFWLTAGTQLVFFTLLELWADRQ